MSDPKKRKKIEPKKEVYNQVIDNTYQNRPDKSLIQKGKPQLQARKQPELKQDNRTKEESKRDAEAFKKVTKPSLKDAIASAPLDALSYIAHPEEMLGDLMTILNSSNSSIYPTSEKRRENYRLQQNNPYASDKIKRRERISRIFNETNDALINIGTAELGYLSNSLASSPFSGYLRQGSKANLIADAIQAGRAVPEALQGDSSSLSEVLLNSVSAMSKMDNFNASGVKDRLLNLKRTFQQNEQYDLAKDLYNLGQSLNQQTQRTEPTFAYGTTNTHGMKKNCRKKYRTGTSMTGVNYVTTPDQAIANMNLMEDQATAEAGADPLLPIVGMLGGLAQSYVTGGMQMPKGAYGTQIGADLMPVEVEGDEVVQTPQGQVQEVEGPSHDEGGVPMEVPEGTQVFADRVKGADGKSMAERKKRREAKLAELRAKLEEDVVDPLKRNTYERTIKNLEAEEAKDLQDQELAGMMASLLQLPHSDNEQEAVAAYGMRKKYIRGTNPGGVNLSNKTHPEDLDFSSPVATTRQPVLPVSNLTIRDVASVDPFQPTASTEITPQASTSSQENSGTSDVAFSPTAGDFTKLAGNIMGMIGPSRNTAMARRGDTVHTNAFADVGREAIETLQNTKGAIQANQATQEATTRRQTAGARRGARRGARGMNEMRAMEALFDMGQMMNEMNIASTAMGQIAGIDAQIAQTQMGASQAKAQGELTARDLNDRDRHNFYTNRSRDAANISKLVQQTGKDLNDLNLNSVQMKLLGSLSQNFKIVKTRDGGFEIVAK